MGQGRQQQHRAEHVDQEHEGQEDAHVGLELERREDPGGDADSQRDAGDEHGFSDDVWREMAQMGWAGIAIPEEFGGLGYGYTGLGLVLEQAGRNLSASPLQSSVLVAATVIAELGSQQQKEQLLPAIAAGEKLVSLALQEGRHHAPQQTAMTATLDGDGYLLNGSKVMVLDEPFSRLDAALRQQVRDQTLHVLKASGAATLMVTHDPELANRSSRQIHLLDGKLIDLSLDQPQPLASHDADDLRASLA